MTPALLILLIAGQLSAAVFGSLTPVAKWYVDSVSGSDSNNGTSTATPFLTIAKVLGEATAAKECIALKRGSQWREKMPLPNAGICVVAYGSGAKPILDSSEVIAGGAWSKTGGRTNIYQATVTTDNELTAFLRAWEDNTALLKATSLDNLDATAARYYTATDSGTSYVLYVHATGSGDPASNGKVYEYNKRSYGVFSPYENHTVSGVHTRRNLANNGSLELGRYAFVNSVKVEDGTKHNALMTEGSTWVDVEVLNSLYFPGESKVALVLFNDTATGKPATLKRIAYTETVELTGAGFFGHISTGGEFGTVTLEDCSTVGAAGSVTGFVSPRMVISGGTFNSAITMGSATSIIRNATVGQISIPFTVSVELDTVISSGAFTNGNVRVGTGPSITPTLNIHDSTFTNSAVFDGAIYVSAAAIPASFTLLNNAFLAPVQVNHIGGPGAADLPIASTINGNTYHYPNATASYIVYRGTNYNISILSPSGWTAWQALGFDATGSRVTP